MVINRKIALVMVLVNIVFLVYCMALFYFTNDSLFKDFIHNRKSLTPYLFNLTLIIKSVLIIALYVGMLWTLRIAKEKKWVRSSIAVSLCGKFLIPFIIPLMISLKYFRYAPSAPFLFIGFCNALFNGYLLIAFLCVRHSAIRRYFKWYAWLMITNYLLAYICPKLYDEFGYAWLSINSRIFFDVAYVVTLLMFIELYHLSRRKTFTPPHGDDLPHPHLL